MSAYISKFFRMEARKIYWQRRAKKAEEEIKTLKKILEARHEFSPKARPKN